MTRSSPKCVCPHGGGACRHPNSWVVFCAEVKGVRMTPSARRAAYEEWKKHVYPAGTTTPGQRRMALCSRIHEMTKAAQGTIEPPPEATVVARTAERPHLSDDLQKLVDSTASKHASQCSMDSGTISSLERVFGVTIPPESRADSCAFLSNALPIGSMGYTINDLLGNGAYGIVINATNKTGARCVMKVTRLYEDDGENHDIEVDFRGESMEWRSVSPAEFDYGLYIHQMLDKLFDQDSLIMMPHVSDAVKVDIDSDGSKIGLLIMSHVSGQPLSSMFSKTRNSELSITVAATVGAVLKRLHEHEIVHGDAHADNFLMGDDGVVYVIDFDRTTSIRGASKAVATACMDYDLVLFMKFSPVHTWKAFLQAYGRTPAITLSKATISKTMAKLWNKYSKYLDKQMAQARS